MRKMENQNGIRPIATNTPGSHAFFSGFGAIQCCGCTQSGYVDILRFDSKPVLIALPKRKSDTSSCLRIVRQCSFLQHMAIGGPVMEKCLRLTLALVVLAVMVSVVALGQAAHTPVDASVPAGVPRLVKFSGLLKDASGNLLTNTVGISFAVYSEQTGGVPLWQETQNVQFSQGHYMVFLGQSKSTGIPAELFASGQPRWLGVTALLPGEQEQPRVLLASVPYALKAVDADTLGGLPAAAFLRAGGNAAMAPPTIPPVFKAGGLPPSGSGPNSSSPSACSTYDVRFIVPGCFSGADVWAQANQAIKTLPVVNGCPTGTISLAYLYSIQKVDTTLDLTNCNSV